MPVTFYPHEDDLQTGSLEEKMEVLKEAAERYKSIVLDMTAKSATPDSSSKKRITPRDLNAAFNWEEIAKLLRQIRDLPEASPSNKLAKANSLIKLAEIYEVLRGAKMPKLEAVRLALVNEANQLKGTSQVA